MRHYNPLPAHTKNSVVVHRDVSRAPAALEDAECSPGWGRMPWIENKEAVRSI